MTKVKICKQLKPIVMKQIQLKLHSGASNGMHQTMAELSSKLHIPMNTLKQLCYESASDKLKIDNVIACCKIKEFQCPDTIKYSQIRLWLEELKYLRTESNLQNK